RLQHAVQRRRQRQHRPALRRGPEGEALHLAAVGGLEGGAELLDLLVAAGDLEAGLLRHGGEGRAGREREEEELEHGPRTLPRRPWQWMAVAAKLLMRSGHEVVMDRRPWSRSPPPLPPQRSIPSPTSTRSSSAGSDRAWEKPRCRSSAAGRWCARGGTCSSPRPPAPARRCPPSWPPSTGCSGRRWRGRWGTRPACSTSRR